MAHITVVMTLSDETVRDGWNSEADLLATVKATLHELNGDDGNVYQPLAFTRLDVQG